MINPETIEIHGLSTIHKLCKFGADHNMEGCSFTEIVERMFAELAKSQAVPEKTCSIQGHEIIINETKNELINDYDIAKEDEYLLEALVYRGVCIGKSQAVPEGFEIGRLQDRITELLDERQELYAQLNTGTTKGFTLVQKDLIQSIHQSCVNSLIAESMPAFKAVANTIIYELSPMVKAIQVEAQEQSHE